MDELAGELGMDPIEFRERNMVQPGRSDGLDRR